MEEQKTPTARRKKKPKVIGLKALLSKKYEFMEGLPEKITRSFGKLVANFIMIVWIEIGFRSPADQGRSTTLTH